MKGPVRALTAILSADVVGYSRLMADDEPATVKTLKAHREAMVGLIGENRGRVVDAKGDNLLAEFQSAVDSVLCAVRIQGRLEEDNSRLAENRRMRFRMGINIGDVIRDDGAIYGDGVNIAARLEGLADPGEVCVSLGVYDQVKKKLDYEFEYLGEHQVKNIEEPVRAYQVLRRSRTGHAEEVVSETNWIGRNHLPERLSLAVLPFMNISRNPDHEYLADGISENIITALSNMPELLVIARNSSFVYKGRAVKVQDVAQDLNVRYVLEGSVQKAGDRLRVTAQLIEAETGHHLWADRYDRRMEDLFQLQDDITLKLAVALQIRLTRGEQSGLDYGRTENLKAWEYVVRGNGRLFKVTRADVAEARGLYRMALDQDPDWALAWVLLGATYFLELKMGYSGSPRDSLGQVLDCVRKAMSLGEVDPITYVFIAQCQLYGKKHDQAEAMAEKAIEAGPNHPDALGLAANVIYYLGRWRDTVDLMRRVLRIHPFCPGLYTYYLGCGLGRLGEFGEAEKCFADMGRIAPDSFLVPMGLALTHSWSGRLEEAREQVIRLRRLKPEFTLAVFAKSAFYKHPEHLETAVEALRRAGLE